MVAQFLVVSSRLIRRRALGFFSGLDLKLHIILGRTLIFFSGVGMNYLRKAEVTKYLLGVAFWKVYILLL